MNDWGGFDNDSAELADYLEPTVPGATAPVRSAGMPTAVGPLVSPLELGRLNNISRGPGVSPPSRRDLEGLRALGTFTPQAVCELKSLAKLAYLFFTNVSTGDTQKALATLGVFRYLYNGSKATITPGFSAAIQAALPASIPDVSWSAEMQRAVGFSLAGALGTSSPAVAVVANLPGNMAAVATWFPTFRNALGAEDVATITDYANQPTSGDYATAIGAIARDDLSACTTATVPSGSVLQPTPTGPTQTYAGRPSGSALVPAAGGAGSGSGGGSGGGASTSGGGAAASSVTGGMSGFLTIALLGLVGYGAYLAYSDGEKSKTQKLSGAPEPSKLLEKALRAAKADAPKMKCLPTAVDRSRVSMDELAGRRGEKLAEEIMNLPPAEALKVENAYFEELDRIRPGAPRCV